MKLYRKVEIDLHKWKNNSKTSALLITGSPKVGKTFTIDDFCQNNFETFFKIDLLTDPITAKFINKIKRADDLLQFLRIHTNSDLLDENTVIFFDEIQVLDDPLTIWKDLLTKTKVRFILSGSMLGISLANIKLYPIGSLVKLKMYPFNFEEFLIALGYQQFQFDFLKQAFDQRIPIEASFHEEVMKNFYSYLVLGGMPSVIVKYLTTQSFLKAREEIDNLCGYYENNCLSHPNVHKRSEIRKIYQSINNELTKKSSRYYLTNLGAKTKYREVKNLFSWLQVAGVAHQCNLLNNPVLPFFFNVGGGYFKLYYHDVGFYSRNFSIAEVNNLLFHHNNTNIGILYENFVACELIAHGHDLYYYNSRKHGEVDFLIARGFQAVPIEVKSGSEYKVHKALNNILPITEYGLKEGIVLCNYNIEVHDNVIYYPIYMTMFLTKFND